MTYYTELNTLAKYGAHTIAVYEIYNGNLSTESNDKTITFYIDNRPYEAKEGMNFAQWLEEYSPDFDAGFVSNYLWIFHTGMRVNDRTR